MFSALLDTCVLVPSVKRDVLLEIAERMVYRPLWTSAILGELGRSIHTIQPKKGGDPQVTETYVRRLTTQMAVAFPDALVVEWERLVGTIELPDPNDRHVVAAAVVGRANVIVTENGKHFPTEKLPTPAVHPGGRYLLARLGRPLPGASRLGRAVRGGPDRAARTDPDRQ